MKTIKIIATLVLSLSLLATDTLYAQAGDQILDGIGETALLARYPFTRDVNDRSRNNLHAQINGSDISFINDNLFRRVLSLPGKSESYISIPGEAITGVGSLSVCGWINLSSSEKDQVFFDFGKDENSHVFIAPAGYQESDNLQVQLVNNSEVKSVCAPALSANRWYHISLVIDFESKTLSTYVNGAISDEKKDINIELEQLFDNKSGNNNLLIGKLTGTRIHGLKARLFDFRIYRIPLSGEQIATIYRNRGRGGINSSRIKLATQELQEFSERTPQLYNQYLVSVPDIRVETVVGHLPQLPRHIPAKYSKSFDGHKVRVIWPAPKDNKQVLSPGNYTVTGSISGTDIKPKAFVTIVEEKDNNYSTPERSLETFELYEVSLDRDIFGRETKFIENRDKFLNVLSNTNPDNFLYMFRNAYGQEQPEGAVALKVWDSQTTKLRGHATGHYLSALAQAYASTYYDKALQNNFASKMDYMVEVLYDLSQKAGKPKTDGGEYIADPAMVPYGPGKTEYSSDLSEDGIRTDYWNWGKGFISAYPPDQFIMLEKGASYGTGDNQVWAPYYTLHKILAGLMDIYEVSGNNKALEIVKDMGKWVNVRLGRVPTDTLMSMWNTYIAGEFGGMNEAMARLYRLCGDKNYMEVAKLFDNIRVFYGDTEHSHGLAKNVDMFRSLHANQHIPQIMGALEIYRDTYSPEYYHISNNFWFMVTNDYLYCIGGVAGARHNPNNAECFTTEPASLYENGFAADGQNETCATYNMLKLTRNLFLFDQRGELMDYYEKGLYNHILASVAEDNPGNTYHVPLRAGSFKSFGNPDMTGFTCCNGTALESSTKLQNSIYFRDKDNTALYVNLYIASTLKWSERNITVRQETAYPYQDNTKLIISGKGRFDINVRVPDWANKGFFVKINGRSLKHNATPGSYLTINRKWKDGDIVEMRMPFQFRLEPVMDQQNITSLFYGPILLAAQESEARTDWRKITLNAKDISKSIKGDPSKLEFKIDNVILKPFYESYGRYSVYFDVILE